MSTITHTRSAAPSRKQTTANPPASNHTKPKHESPKHQDTTTFSTEAAKKVQTTSEGVQHKMHLADSVLEFGEKAHEGIEELTHAFKKHFGGHHAAPAAHAAKPGNIGGQATPLANQLSKSPKTPSGPVPTAIRPAPSRLSSAPQGPLASKLGPGTAGDMSLIRRAPTLKAPAAAPETPQFGKAIAGLGLASGALGTANEMNNFAHATTEKGKVYHGAGVAANYSNFASGALTLAGHTKFLGPAAAALGTGIDGGRDIYLGQQNKDEHKVHVGQAKCVGAGLMAGSMACGPAAPFVFAAGVGVSTGAWLASDDGQHTLQEVGNFLTGAKKAHH